jgi:hypothetical protein
MAEDGSNTYIWNSIPRVMKERKSVSLAGTYFTSPPFSLILSTKLTYFFLTATSFAL